MPECRIRLIPLPPATGLSADLGVVLEDGVVGKSGRRKRSWYRRRLRLQRTVMALAVGLLLAAVCWQNAARYLSLPTLHPSQVLPASFWTRGNISRDLSLAAAHSARPAKPLPRISNVFPYSIIPGGVKDASDLRYAALRDYVVRRHYAHFDLSRAHLVRATEAREVYLSYRIRDSVFWTRRRVRLHLGELLLTDGKITARARCGNQISDTAKPDVSEEEPDEDILDQPVTALDSAPFWPGRPRLASPDLPSFDPAAPKLFASNFTFPYEPVGVPLPYGKCPANDNTVDGHCRKKRPKGPAVPEPSTLVLAASGLAFTFWRYRKTYCPVAA
jgi:hypothetical protein